MSLISNNLKYLRRINGLTQDSFARRIGTKRANIGAYEESRAIPPVETLKIIANTFGISVDDLVKKDIRRLKETPDLTFEFDPKSVNLTDNQRVRERRSFTDDFENPPSIGNLMNDFLPKDDFFNKEPVAKVKPFDFNPNAFETPKKDPVFDYTPPTYSRPQSVDYQPDAVSNGNIQLVKRFQFNEYLTKFQDLHFLNNLTKFSIPTLPLGEYRAFEAGEDFAFEGALLIGSLIKNPVEIQDGKNYVLVTKSQGVIYRRVYNRVNDKGTILLSADNHRFPTIEVSIKDLIEAWDVKAFISQIMPEPAKSFEKVNNLVDELKFEIERLKK